MWSSRRVSPWKILHWVFVPNFFWDSLYVWGSQENILGQKVNVKFFRVYPYTLGNRIPQAFQNLSDLHIWCRREKLYIGYLSENTCGEVRKKIGALDCFEKLKQFLKGLAIFRQPLVCESFWKIAKPPKNGFSLSKQTSAETFQMQLVYHRAGCASQSGPIDLKLWFQA